MQEIYTVNVATWAEWKCKIRHWSATLRGESNSGDMYVCVCVCVCVCVWKSLSCIWLLRPHGLYSPWNSPGQNTRVGSLSILQGIFPNQGLNPGLPHCRRILYQLSHKGSPRILEWVTYPFSRGSSLPQELNRGLLHCREFFTSWATREECVCVCVYVCVCVCVYVHACTYTQCRILSLHHL